MLVLLGFFGLLVVSPVFAQVRPCVGGSHVFASVQPVTGTVLSTGTGTNPAACGSVCLGVIGCTYWMYESGSPPACTLYSGTAPAVQSCSGQSGCVIVGTVSVGTYIQNVVWISPGTLISTQAGVTDPVQCQLSCDAVRCSAWTITSAGCNMYLGQPITNPGPSTFTSSSGSWAGLGNMCPTLSYVINGYTFDLTSMDHDVDYLVTVPFSGHTYDIYVSPPNRQVTQPTEGACTAGSPYEPTAVIQTTPICVRVAGTTITASLYNPSVPTAGISLLFAGGDSTFCANARSAIVNIICDSSLPNTAGPDTTVEVNPHDSCSGIINWPHPAGCPLHAATSASPTPAPSHAISAVPTHAACTIPVTMGPQAMEGNLVVQPGQLLSIGYEFTYPGNQPSQGPIAVTVLGGGVTFSVQCAGSSTPVSYTVPLPSSATTTIPAGSTAWFPTQFSQTCQASATVPALCGTGKSMNFGNGGTFTTTVQSNAAFTAGDGFHIQWHYTTQATSGNCDGGWSNTAHMKCS